ncbi:Predicted transcriptional regulator [Slackia heliotrinireducens]|uniref:Predicted transcriptional regulator n=1 Tax=Slackia heliotrinireducens (strain ATCC 29202 / DSM 20476 / NCTC 11029 / RHS 1) TaxID=471855 RepID=C7N6S8_SLAHD|nr:helix-turn-helix transcriptional regulator [Slackia heliotrinireducens]ACV22613.1 predicted transcriptional regulator [Slackia heliotrinireducens DSM 20476]VEH01135.1 Predicted transcriptional regulator [Slackia heliotrinireducens]
MEIQLNRLRNLRGLSQEDMAQRLGIKKSRYGTWERGERMMNLAQACQCCDVLGCSLDELAGREAPHLYTDRRQETLNEDFARLDNEGKDAAMAAVRGIASMQAEKSVSRPRSDGAEGAA